MAVISYRCGRIVMPTPSAGNLRLLAPERDREAIDAHTLANQELIRPLTYHPSRRASRGPEPFSEAWFAEIESRRYARHGAWLPYALEFHRHPGESVLIVHPGLGTDAIQYRKQGLEVTVLLGRHDPGELVRSNFQRHQLLARFVDWEGTSFPFRENNFDLALFNGLYHGEPDRTAMVAELYRVLKPGGKVIGLFPAKYDAGYWQDLALPLQFLYWHRPPDPTTSPKTTGRALRRLFAPFEEHRVCKRHLRRSELPHLWRLWPLALLERFLGRVLVLKALKPLPVIDSLSIASSPSSLAA